MEKQVHPQPSIGLSLLPVGTLVALLALVIYIFGGDALSGGSQVVLLFATALCAVIAHFHSHIKW